MVSAATKLKDTCSLEVKLCKHRQCIKKQRYYSAEKLCIVKGMVFPVVIYACESWTIKKALNTEELMLVNCGVGEDFKVPWTARRSKQSILKEIYSEY